MRYYSSLPLFLLVTSCSAASNWKKLPAAAALQSRRWLNLGSTFGSALQTATVYDRIAGHPVFAVTTPWGSPYMNMEKLSDIDETVPVSQSMDASSKKSPTSLSEEQSEFRMVALYFMDPADALAVHGEMKQMDNMEKSDIRLTTFSLAKALRQASNLGQGLLTGLPCDPLNGKLPVEEGGVLRYKIVPPKRQLYYAARCIGKERVGLFSESAAEDAAMAVIGNSALESANLMRRLEKRERKNPRQKKRTAMEAANAHMEGYSGVPVFYCANMQKQLPIIKQLLSGCRHETPFFFNYEDLTDAWDKTRQTKRSQKQHGTLPEKPVVEVFNLWDVISSMDKQRKQSDWKKDPIGALQRRLLITKEPAGLQDITFVPNSDSVHYKDAISRRGNGKARLRPMR